MVKVRLRSLIAENVLKMVCPKRTAILPLCIAKTIALANGNPTMAAHRLPRSGVGLLKPRDHQRRFRLELAMRNVVIRQREVEWILPRHEGYRNVIAPRGRIISPAITRR